MMKKSLLLLMMMLVSAFSFAQDRKISGVLVDGETKEPVMQTTVQLITMDSAFVAGAVSNERGAFTITAPKNGKYLLRISSIGYIGVLKRLEIVGNKNLNLGIVKMESDAKMLSQVNVTGKALKVVVKEDTFVYNSAAYVTPEGSVVEELVKRLPGAQVSEDGKITINGKEVKKVKVGGKEFMTGDTQTAMKNLPTSIIDNIKVYDERSDLSRITGIDDGNDETVLDFSVKPGMNKGFMSNVDLGYGTHDRYTGRLFGMYTKDNFRIQGMGNANNTGDRGFGGRGGGGRGGQGLNSSKMAGFNFSYDNDTIQIGGSVRWNHRDGDVMSRRAVENFISRSGAFENSVNQNFSRSDSWNAQLRLEWKPDTMTNIMFRPSMSISSNDGLTSSSSASFNADPYKYVFNPLLEQGLNELAKWSVTDIAGVYGLQKEILQIYQNNPTITIPGIIPLIPDYELDEIKTEVENLISNNYLTRKLINQQSNYNISYGKSASFNGMLQFNRKLNNRGRNFTLRVDGSYSRNDNNNLSINNVILYQQFNREGLDSTYQTNRYSITPTKSYSYSVQTIYSEPLWRGAFLQLSYRFNYSTNKSDRSTYDFSNLGENFFAGIKPDYRKWDDYIDRVSYWHVYQLGRNGDRWDNYLDRLSQPYTEYLDKDLSRYSEYKNYTHNVEAQLRVIREKYNFNVGLLFQPQRSKFIQDYKGVYVDTVRTVFNISPTLDFRYRFSKRDDLRITYRANTQQPSVSQMLDIYDDSDPLRISTGNPGLKPSFTQNLSGFFNGYIQNHMRSIMSFVNFSTTKNSISQKVTYNEKTGGQITRPENINGNWNVMIGSMYNQSIDTIGVWFVNTFTNLSYSNHVGYVSLDRMSDSQKNTTPDITVGERLSLSFRPTIGLWSTEFEIDGSGTYNHARNKLQKQGNLDTWEFSYGGSVNVTAPWGTSLSMDMHNRSRRGFTDKSMNTNELIWNAQVSQGFLRGRSLTISLQLYDILHNQSNFSRMISAMSSTDTWYNSINSYAMVHVVYRFNLFGGKNANQGMPGMGGFGRGGFGGGRPAGGGGFGGGRPMGGGGFGGGRPMGPMM